MREILKVIKSIENELFLIKWENTSYNALGMQHT